MASAVDGTKKRNIHESKKKGKNSSSNEETLSAIEKGALAGKDPEKANYVVELLKQLQSNSKETKIEAVRGLLVCFQTIIAGNPEWTSPPQSKTETPLTLSPSDEYKVWLRQGYEEFHRGLCCLVTDTSSDVQVEALNTAMSLIKLEAETLHVVSGVFTFPKNTFNDLLLALLMDEPSGSHLVSFFEAEYLKYTDVQVFTLRSIVKAFPAAIEVKNPDEMVHTTANMYVILNSIRRKMKNMTSDKGDLTEGGREFFAYKKECVLQDGQPPAKKRKENKAKKHKTIDVESLKELQKWYTEAWLMFLQLPLKSRMYKEILVYLHSDIIPHMSDPKRLIDFLTSCYDIGGVISILALNGLFILIHKHHLDYPEFYKHLYSVLDASILPAKHMQRFFHLLDIFLSSTHLPLYLVAAFVKKLSRMALSSPPHGVIVVVVMVSNLIKRHPNCKKLLHRKESVGVGEDPFVESETDPSKCNALESSLWELQTLKQHYSPGVADLVCKLLSPEELAKPEERLGEYLDLTFDELFKETLVSVEEDTDIPMAFGPPRHCFSTDTQHSQHMYKLS